MLALLNRLSDATWDGVSRQLLRIGVVSASSIATSTAVLLTDQLPELSSLAAAASPTTEDLRVMANCACAASSAGLVLHLADVDAGAAQAAEVAVILRAAGAGRIGMSRLLPGSE